MQKDSLYFFRGERERKREGKKDNSKLSLSLGKLSSIAKRFSFFPPRYTKKPDEKNTITIASSLLLKSIDRRNGSKSCLNTI